ncbi:MAG: hypothetical protein AAGD10_13665 [Myxococcota bacterium]
MASRVRLASVPGLVWALGCSAVLDEGARPVDGIVRRVDEGPDRPPASSEPPVFLKKARQLEADLATALVLPKAEVCRELGSEDCVEVHNIVLGGVEPYSLRIDIPLAEPSATTPLALERLVWGACGRAVDRDLGLGPVEVLEMKADGLDRPASARRLAEALLHGSVQDEQLHALVEFGGELDDEAWALSVCVAVASSFGAVFY